MGGPEYVVGFVQPSSTERITEMTRPLPEAFGSIQWHDRPLHCIRVSPNPSDARVCLEFGAESNFEAMAIEFIECLVVDSNLYYPALTATGGSLASARCRSADAYRERVAQARDDLGDPRRGSDDGLWLFVFRFVPPGGELTVVARDFRVLIG